MHTNRPSGDQSGFTSSGPDHGPAPGKRARTDALPATRAPGAGAVVQARPVTGGGTPVVQRKIGFGDSAPSLEAGAVGRLLGQQGQLVSEQDEALLSQWDREGRVFPGGLPEVIAALRGPRSRSGSSASSDAGAMSTTSDLSPRREVPTAAPRDHVGATDQWARYAAAALADLAWVAEQLRGAGQTAPDPGTRDELDRAVTAVLLYQAHAASMVDLNPASTSTGDGALTVRQDNPYERENPGFYYRSQLKDHPLFVLYKDGITATTEHGRDSILPPYNTGVEDLIRGSTADGTTAKKQLKVTHPDGLTIKDGGHSELDAAYMGLRRTNAVSILDLVDRFVGADGGIAKLSDFLTGAANSRKIPLEDATGRVKRDDLTEADLDRVLDQVGDVMHRLGRLDQPGPDGGHDLGGGGPIVLDDEEQRLRAEMMRALTADGHWHHPVAEGVIHVRTTGGGRGGPLGDQPKLVWSMEPHLDDPIRASSYVVRKVEQATERADALLRAIGELTYLRVGRVSGNSMLTLEIPFDKDINDKQQSGFVALVRVYLGTAITRAAAVNAPLVAQFRQSFGSLETTLADTEPAIRISVGTEPMAFVLAVAQAVRTVDAELRALVDAKRGNASSRKALFGVTKGWSAYQTMDSPTLQRLVYLKALARELDLEGLVAYVKGTALTKDVEAAAGKKGSKKAGKGKTDKPTIGSEVRSALWTTLQKEAQAVLSRLAATGGGALDDDHEGDDHEGELGEGGLGEGGLGGGTGGPGAAGPTSYPIVEPLQNALTLVATLLHRVGDGRGLPPASVGVRRAALDDLSANLATLQLLLDAVALPHDSRRGARLHSDLRNVTEDLVQALVIFLHTTHVYDDADPEASTAAWMNEALGLDTEVVRTDSGEQAGSVALTLSKAEHDAAGSAFTLGSSNPYFELPTFIDHNQIGDEPDEGELPSTMLIDPRPFLVNVPDAGSDTEGEGGGRGPRGNPLDMPLARELLKLEQRLPKVSTGKGKGKKEKGPTAPPTLTIIIDTTHLDYAHPEILGAVAAVRASIVDDRLRIVLYNSGVKHEQLSSDKYQTGRIAVLGRKLPGLKNFSASPLVNQLLGLLEDLRAIDEDDPGDFAVDVAGVPWTDYDRFMALVGASSWDELRATIDRAIAAKDPDAAQEAAETALAMYGEAIEQLVAVFAGTAPVDPKLNEAFAALPARDREGVQAALLARTEAPKPSPSGGGRGGTGSTGSTGGARGRAVGPLAGLEAPVDGGHGIPNIGNSCYIAAALHLIAFTGPYREMFVARPVGDGVAVDPVAVERAEIDGLLIAVLAGAEIAGERITHLRATLHRLGLLLPPSRGEQPRGGADLTVQQDPSEVFLRRVLPHFAAGGAGELTVRQTTVTDFTGTPTEAVPGADPARYTAIDGAPVWREVHDDLVLELPITDCGNLVQAVGRHLRDGYITDARAVQGGGVVMADPVRRTELGDATPRAVTIALQRSAGPWKDDHAVDMPEQFLLRGRRYLLATVVHHHGASVSGGHYTASTRSGAHGAWQHRDDGRVADMDADRATARRNTGYLFSYVRQDGGGLVPHGIADLNTADAGPRLPPRAGVHLPPPGLPPPSLHRPDMQPDGEESIDRGAIEETYDERGGDAAFSFGSGGFGGFGGGTSGGFGTGFGGFGGGTSGGFGTGFGGGFGGGFGSPARDDDDDAPPPRPEPHKRRRVTNRDDRRQSAEHDPVVLGETPEQARDRERDQQRKVALGKRAPLPPLDRDRREDDEDPDL